MPWTQWESYSKETVATRTRRYNVAQPWKQVVCFEDNRKVAEKHLVQLIRRLRGNDDIMTLLCERTRKVERQSLFLPREQQICASQKSGKRLQVSKKKNGTNRTFCWYTDVQLYTHSEPLSVQEIARAKVYLLRMVQRDSLSSEIYRNRRLMRIPK